MLDTYTEFHCSRCCFNVLGFISILLLVCNGMSVMIPHGNSVPHAEIFFCCSAEPHSSVGSIQGLRTGGRWYDPRLGQYSFRRLMSHYDRIHSPLIIDHCSDNGYVGKQPVAGEEYCLEYWLTLCRTSLLKKLWVKEKLLVTNNFSFSFGVFYLSNFLQFSSSLKWSSANSLSLEESENSRLGKG